MLYEYQIESPNDTIGIEDGLLESMAPEPLWSVEEMTVCLRLVIPLCINALAHIYIFIYMGVNRFSPAGD